MLTTPGDTMHDKETFRDWLLFVGYTPIEMEQITKRLREQKGTYNDHALYDEYLETKDLKHLYDE